MIIEKYYKPENIIKISNNFYILGNTTFVLPEVFSIYLDLKLLGRRNSKEILRYLKKISKNV